GFLELVQQPLRVDRLFEEIERAGLHGLDRPWNIALARHDNDLGIRVEQLELTHELYAVDIREHHVGDYRVGPPGLEELFAAGADEGGSHLVTRVLQENFQPLGHRRLIVDRKYTFLTFDAHARQNVAKKRNLSIHISVTSLLLIHMAG